MNAELRRKYRETRRMILRDFPALLLYKPYKIGIFKDVIAHYKSACIDVDRRMLSRVFYSLTGRTAYLSQVIHGACRFDLHGQSAGDVTEAHREIALSMLSKMKKEKAKRKKQAKKLAQEEKARLAEDEKTKRKAEKEAEQKAEAAASEAVTRPATEKPPVVITRRGRTYQRPENP